MVLNAAVQMLREADELKQTVLRFKSGTSMLQDRNLWTTQQQLQKVYQKILILDLDYALEKKVEQDLWNVGFKQQIEALQAISKDRKNPLRSDAQAMLSWILQAAAGFYLCLLHQICSTFKLDLPFRRRASLLGAVEGWEASGGAGGSAGGAGSAAAARYASQHCLVHLGDLARYRQQLRLAHTFYKHALAVSPHSGQPYNQLALVWWRRGRRLQAVYWHVRSLLVRAPFPPAPANLARTLAAAVATPIDNGDRDSLPVLGGVSPAAAPARAGRAPERIDAHSYCHEFLRALHYIHSVEQLDTAASLVESLNWSLTPLVATDSFDSTTLIQMTCILMWAVVSSAEGGAPAAEELAAARLAEALAAASLLALLLPAPAGDEPPRPALPALMVWLQWLSTAPALCRSGAWRARPQLWGALAHALSALAPAAHAAHAQHNKYESVPLPEDEELQGFLPLAEAHRGLRFAHAAHQACSLPDLQQVDDDTGPPSEGWGGDGEREHTERARRLLRLGARLADAHPDHLAYTTDVDGKMSFTSSALDGEQLARTLAELAVCAPPAPPAPPPQPSHPPPPVIISEADFREKVRDKRVGILKPQGSLERAREERAAAAPAPPPAPPAAPQQEAETSDDSGMGEERREARKPRVNIAMAAIMRKQEETNKQVKFVTPPPTPDSSGEGAEAPRVLQPKPVKSLANLPVGRKTGGILSLKDKSGYPHLVNVDPEPRKPDDKPGAAPGPPPAPQPPPKRPDPAPPAWGAAPSQQTYPDVSRMSFQKTYGIQAGVGYSPAYGGAGPVSPPGPTPGQFIKLPVVNPKEIDVRTAALQKQSSRQDMFPEANKFAAQGYQPSADKMNFLNDLPPRFANQYRYWHAAHDAQFAAPERPERRDEPFQPAPQPPAWWKPDAPPPFAPSYGSVPMSAPNYYSVPAGAGSAGGGYRGGQYGADEGARGGFGFAAGGYGQLGRPGYPPLQADGALGFGASLLDPQQRTINFGDPFGSLSGVSTSDQRSREAGGVSSGAGVPETGGYSLFSAQQAWPAAAARGSAQSLWSGSQSPLERLLEQQKQKKPQ